MPTLYTHGSIFHADEVIGAALLVYLGEIAITDIRRVNTLPAALASGDFVLDIGGKLAVEEGVTFLDHHQDKELQCAAALVYKHFDARWTTAQKKAIERFLDGVDKDDRGLAYHAKGTMTLSNIIAGLNPVGEATEDMRTANFIEAATVFLAFFRRMVAYQELVESQAALVSALVAQNTPYVVADAHLPKLLRSLEGTLTRHALYPSLRGGWNLQAVCIPTTKTPVQVIPADIAGATFVHATGFIAGFATKEDAIAAAEILAKVEIFVPVKAEEEIVIPLPGAAKSSANNPFGV
jgi:uncharacterized UPF0160 family protein